MANVEPDHQEVTKNIMQEHMQRVMRVYGCPPKIKAKKPFNPYAAPERLNRSTNFSQSGDRYATKI